MAHRHHHYVYRRRNPFATGNMNQLAVKVAGALAGAVGAASIPSMLSPSLSSGWAGVASALVVAFGGAYLAGKASANLGEGVLIGGSVQALSRALTLLTGKTFLTASMGQYGSLNFPIPTPAYGGGAGVGAPAIAASASKTSGTKAAIPAASGMGRMKPYSKYVA